MTKMILEQCCDLQNEIKKLKERLERIHKQSSIVSDIVQNRIQKKSSSKTE